MTRFWFVRHGPTHRNGMVGWTDAPADLSDTAKISRLDGYLPKDAVLISSDLSRTIDTAKALQANREVLEVSPDLREFSFGTWEDRTFDDISKTDPELSLQYWSNPGDTSPPNGESWNVGSTRMSKAIDDLLTNHPNRDIIVVVHFGVILTQLQRATNMPPASALAFKIDNLSVTTIEHMGTAWRVLGVNHTP